jgi:hypothetical protein
MYITYLTKWCVIEYKGEGASPNRIDVDGEVVCLMTLLRLGQRRSWLHEIYPGGVILILQV